MTGKIGSNPPSVPQDVSSANAAETVKQSETKAGQPAPKDSTGGAPPASTQQNPSAKMAEFALGGMARAAQFLSFKPEAGAKLPTDELLKRNDHQKTSKPEVQELQKQVNQWRAENGKKPIKEDGFFGERTERAVAEFQKANGLQRDGQAGIATQNRVVLENDPGFKKMDSGIKDQVRTQMTAYDQDKTKAGNLREFATTRGLSEFSPAHQQQMLDLQKSRPDDGKFTSQLKTLAGDPTFQLSNDATKTRVLNDVSKYAGDPGKIDNLTKLATAPSFDQLKTAEQTKMLDALAKHPDDSQLAESLGRLASHPGYKHQTDAIKGSLVDTFSSSSPLKKENFDSTMGLVSSPQFRRLSDGEKSIVADGLKGAKANAAYAENIKKLLDDTKFQTLNEAERTAVLSQVKNYPDARSVNNIQRMLQKDWFTSQDLADKQRSLKTVGYLSQYDAGDRRVVDNTLEKFVGEKSDYKLVWKEYKDKAGSTTYGEADGKTLWLNKGIMAADNQKMVENASTKHLVLSTTPHEVNHLLNGDKVAKTYKYFEAEYRAWYVGFKAQNGREPTNQEAMQQRISWQLNPDSFYGKYAKDALKDPAEAAKFYDLLGKMSGQKVDAKNWETVIKSDPTTWPSKNDPAPVPAGNIDNH